MMKRRIKYFFRIGKNEEQTKNKKKIFAEQRAANNSSSNGNAYSELFFQAPQLLHFYILNSKMNRRT